MAELVLSAAGGAIGRQLLPQGVALLGGKIAGATIGRALGGLAGSVIDARLAPPREGPRIREFHVTESVEGASVPVVYGRMRVGGQVIWASRFKEKREVHGGKGGPRTADYSYSISFAVGLCDGEVTQVTRCWANGEPLDLSKVNWRLYPGTEGQAPDPLIAAVEGAAPGYRGLAYVVFEDFVVDAFGARMPQLSFEVQRPAAGTGARLETMARGVNLIPGSGEFALASDVVRRVIGPGREVAENQHGSKAVGDLEEALDQLQAELPGVTRVNLVVAWFGDDLRCAECVIRPGVEGHGRMTKPFAWSVAGVEREDAYVVSATEGRPNYGGTPADECVRQAVAALRGRGMHVTFYPFLLMDVPAGNGKPDPYGGAEQAAFPWRGRITVSPGAEGTSDATDEIATFFERTSGYREFVLHCAALAQETGCEGFLIGSELVGLTRVRDGGGAYPAVEKLRVLAGDVRALLGDDVEISYGADWTEYGADVRDGGSDVAFPLDALWADPSISYVGLDWYPPMADWRDGEGHADFALGLETSRGYLDSNIEGGEGYDWFYADDAGRAAQDRLAITDGAYGEPWVFRVKDVRGWWAREHHSRVDGVRSGTATGWTPGMKPVRFVEFGAPAVDKGANQPNVFYDPKSSESALPHFSDGTRDDLIQRAAIEAFHAHWTDADNNPASGAYDGRMVPDDGIVLWTWDARPWPAFPSDEEAWSDAGNWRLGHWLNGRVGATLLADVVADVCARAGAEANVDGLSGVVAGYRFDGPASARSVLAPLALAYGIDAVEREGATAFRLRDDAATALDAGLLVEDENGSSLEVVRDGMELARASVRLRFIDAEADQAPGLVLSEGADISEAVDLEAAVALDRSEAQRRANELAEELTLKREQARFAMAAEGLAFEAGDVVALPSGSYRILEAVDGGVVRFSGCGAGPGRAAAKAGADTGGRPPVGSPVEPDVAIVEAPPLPGEEDDFRPIAFAFSDPWLKPVTISAGADATQLSVRGRIEQPCAIGRLTTALFPHVSGRWQETSVWVSLPGASLSSRPDIAVLNGANAALVETEAGWELIQFAQAELVDNEVYKLSRLLRGQQGSEPAMAAGASVGARVLFLTGAERRVEAADWERGLELVWTAWRDSPDEAVAASETLVMTGETGRMWSPAHLRVAWEGDDLGLSWIRRARKGGDAWGPGEPPFETVEGYRVSVSAGGVEKRRIEAASPEAVYGAAMMAADFPAGGAATIAVAQLGADGEPGAWASLEVTVPVP